MWPTLPIALGIFWGIEFLARLSAIVLFEMPIIWPSSCFLVTTFLVEAGPLLTRLAKSGFVLSVYTLRLAAPTLLARSLDLKEERFTLLVCFVEVIALVP
jgi:hypothetical protein